MVLEGIRSFASSYRGKLVSETMLVDKENTKLEELTQLAAYLKGISLSKAYLSIPYRPPAEPGVRVPDAEQLDRAERVFEEVGLKVCNLSQREGDKSTVSADPAL
jgi:wyosine [tRNA(Phe)-imidazoG37] synthetase (radical SAM superfamily)